MSKHREKVWERIHKDSALVRTFNGRDREKFDIAYSAGMRRASEIAMRVGARKTAIEIWDEMKAGEK